MFPSNLIRPSRKTTVFQRNIITVLQTPFIITRVQMFPAKRVSWLFIAAINYFNNDCSMAKRLQQWYNTRRNVICSI